VGWADDSVVERTGKRLRSIFGNGDEASAPAPVPAEDVDEDGEISLSDRLDLVDEARGPPRLQAPDLASELYAFPPLRDARHTNARVYARSKKGEPHPTILLARLEVSTDIQTLRNAQLSPNALPLNAPKWRSARLWLRLRCRSSGRRGRRVAPRSGLVGGSRVASRRRPGLGGRLLRLRRW
jgi:hypothetical protein